jgi:hypothetical protein
MGVDMVWAPSESNQKAVKFWLGCLQVVTVVAGVATAVGTFVYHSKEERSRAIEQERHTREQLENVGRELQRPYREKQLNLYLDAARVLAHLATSPSVDQEKNEARFWELYWGELAFVESKTEEEGKIGPEGKVGPSPSVERFMVQFCHQYFSSSPERCSAKAPSDPVKVSTTPIEKTAIEKAAIEKAAIEMARGASDEIRAQWEELKKSKN